MMPYEYHVKSRTIRRLLKGVVPPGVHIESVLIANVRSRAKVIISGIVYSRLLMDFDLVA